MTIDVDPVAFKIGSLPVHWYGIIMGVALVAGLFVFSRGVRQRGISPDHVFGIAIIAVPCGIIGARMFHVFDNPAYFWAHPEKIFGGQLAGLAIYGVITGGVLGLLAYCRWKRLPILRILDATALAFPVAQIIGRCANIVNGDTWGPATTLPWGFVYVNPRSLIPDELLGVATHPTPVYEQIWLVVMLVILLALIPRLKTDGLAFFAYVGLYSAGRFLISYFRVNNIIALGLREAQLIALAGVVLASAAGYVLWRRGRAGSARSSASRVPRRTPSA